MADQLDTGYLLAVAAAAVWTPRPLVAMLAALGSARALVHYAREPAVLPAPPCELLGKDVLGRLAAIDDEDAESALGQATREGQLFVTSADAAFPTRLRDLCDPPPVLYYRGNLEALGGRTLAVVGSRAATPYGRSMTNAIATGMAAYGATVISGLARGIDAAAHRAAVGAAVPTVAVIGSGLRSLYPPYHKLLADEIVAGGGAVISEFPPSMPARQHHFPMRNRLVAALAEATVVVEAGAKSGALITARLAGELGRHVFAIPGDVGRTTSEGSNALIKDGVMLATGADDIAAVLSWQAALRASPRAAASESTLLAALARSGSGVDELCAATGLDAAAVNAQLTMLEMQGLVERHPGGLYTPSS